MKFIRKEPVIIEAWAVSVLLSQARNEWHKLPKPIIELHERGAIIFASGHIEVMDADSIAGAFKCGVDEWIIRDEDGMYYPAGADFLEEFEEYQEGDKL